MVRFGVRAAAVLVAAAGAVAVGAVPSAAADPAELAFWSGDFSGTSANYATVPEGCTPLPFVAHSELNPTPAAIRVYESTDCTGHALFFPANDIHGFPTFDARSFQVG